MQNTSDTITFDAQLHAAALGHLQAAGAPDGDQQAADFVQRVRNGEASRPAATDTVLWGGTSIALGASLSPDDQMRVARQLIGELRRLRDPHRRTWLPGDELPTPPPAKISDLDGDVWLHQTDAGNGCYRMSSKDRRALAGTIGDWSGVQVWPFLLDAEGPFTEVAAAR